MRRVGYIPMLIILLFGLKASASHIVGGVVTYKFVRSYSGGNIYEIKLVIYEDCLNGQPDAIEADAPGFLGVYDTGRSLTSGFKFRDWLYTADTTVPVYDKGKIDVNFDNRCVTNVPSVCLQQKIFIKNFSLPNNSAGYFISYERCCRNAATINIVSPGDKGTVYYCYIPPVSVVANNNSAVFKNYPPQIICRSNPLYYDHSATDADGDSLSYEFCTADDGATSDDVKPIPGTAKYVIPPFKPVAYFSPTFSAARPLSAYPVLQIDPRTGLMTGTPNRLGRFLVTVCCHEWRRGVMINTVKREFQFTVTDCSKTVFACMPQYSTDVNTYIVQCDGFTVHFDNCSSGGFSYHWDFGVPGTDADTSNEFSPTFTYPDTGIYLVTLSVNKGSTCPDSISKMVKIFPYFKTSFSDSGIFCPGLPIYFKDKSAATIKPVNSWNWNFGDGEFATSQDTTHIYSAGGVYNVMLISTNIKNCIDSFVRQVVVDNFQPFAGHDTTIVKGESIQFNAVGGYDYTWIPSTYLNDSTISNPVGYYPDTGMFRYVVKVTSTFGCQGNDSIRVWVVNQAAFYMPNAFTPNGDGKNDVYRPVSIGYRSLKFFRIYNRFGEVIYYSGDINEGWDGTYKHTLAELGTYYWQIAYIDRFGKERYQKGDVTLIR